MSNKRSWPWPDRSRRGWVLPPSTTSPPSRLARAKVSSQGLAVAAARWWVSFCALCFSLWRDTLPVGARFSWIERQFFSFWEWMRLRVGGNWVMGQTHGDQFPLFPICLTGTSIRIMSLRNYLYTHVHLICPRAEPLLLLLTVYTFFSFLCFRMCSVQICFYCLLLLSCSLFYFTLSQLFIISFIVFAFLHFPLF